jgi:hypothetical protein
MTLVKRSRIEVLTLLLAALLLAVPAAARQKAKKEKPAVGSAPAVLWREPVDIRSRDLFYGVGGKEKVPQGGFSFIGEKKRGTSPKFDVRDENGIRWGVKYGAEAKPETAATRLLWAVGYFVNTDYFVDELKVGGLPPLSRGEELISHGKIHGARLKRHNKGERKIGFWTWRKNPFVGTRELNGLKVMMEIFANTDFTYENQCIYDVQGIEQQYMVTDLGASFGKAGKTIYRAKGVLKDYLERPLIKHVDPEFVDFWYFKHIPRADARWIGGFLAQLSEEQIRDAFRAAGYSQKEVEGFAGKVREKISELNVL